MSVTYTPKVYLGDGVFVQSDSLGRVILSTEDGMEITNRIYLEPEQLHGLYLWLNVMRNKVRKQKGSEQ